MNSFITSRAVKSVYFKASQLVPVCAARVENLWAGSVVPEPLGWEGKEFPQCLWRRLRGGKLGSKEAEGPVSQTPVSFCPDEPGWTEWVEGRSQCVRGTCRRSPRVNQAVSLSSALILNTAEREGLPSYSSNSDTTRAGSHLRNLVPSSQ